MGISKCLTCHNGGRGQSAPKKAESLRGHPDKNQNFLDCRCPVETALLELWMAKVTARRGDIPERPVEKETTTKKASTSALKTSSSKTSSSKASSSKDGLTNADFATNPALLRVFQSAINEVSGLTLEELFVPPEQRWIIAIRHLIGRLRTIEDFDEGSVELKLLSQAEKALLQFDNMMCFK